MPPMYYPLAVIFGLGLVNELFSFALIMVKKGNMASSNVYILLEFILLIWQFQKWNYWTNRLPLTIVSVGSIVWVFDNLILRSIDADNSLFRMMYSALVVLLSMQQVARIVVNEYKPGKNPKFIFCTGFILYYIFKTYYESFNLIFTGVSNNFFYWLWLTLNTINLVTNLIYTYAILCIKKKIPFTLPY